VQSTDTEIKIESKTLTINVKLPSEVKSDSYTVEADALVKTVRRAFSCCLASAVLFVVAAVAQVL
jgi:hypothetical protein